MQAWMLAAKCKVQNAKQPGDAMTWHAVAHGSEDVVQVQVRVANLRVRVRVRVPARLPAMVIDGAMVCVGFEIAYLGRISRMVNSLRREHSVSVRSCLFSTIRKSQLPSSDRDKTKRPRC